MGRPGSQALLPFSCKNPILSGAPEGAKAAACFGQDDSGEKDLLGKEEWSNHGLIMGHPSFWATRKGVLMD